MASGLKWTSFQLSESLSKCTESHCPTIFKFFSDNFSWKASKFNWRARNYFFRIPKGQLGPYWEIVRFLQHSPSLFRSLPQNSDCMVWITLSVLRVEKLVVLQSSLLYATSSNCCTHPKTTCNMFSWYILLEHLVICECQCPSRPFWILKVEVGNLIYFLFAL